jgi:uncharacterized DUF497 family protein
MIVTYDPAKRTQTLLARGLDFKDAKKVFSGITFEFEDTRKDYGEQRVICIGLPQGRMVMVGYVQREAARHVFSMRKCNARETERFQAYLDQAD